MNILLVNPKPSEAYTVYGPSLGLCYLSAYLKKRGIPSIKGIDLNVDSPEDLDRAIGRADLVGVYCSTKALRAALAVARAARAAGKIVVFGGPHASVLPDQILRSPDVDYVVLSEGESTFYELVQTIRGGGGIPRIDGLGYKDGDVRVIHPRTRYIRDLDTIPFPDRSLFRFDTTRYITFCATRGCPYRCANCQPALSLQTCAFRMRSVENVLAELRETAQGREIHFVDNDLTVNRKWIRALCDGILSSGLKFRWNCEGRVNTLDRELLAAMKRAGCESVGIGIESGSQELLDGFLRKQIDLGRATELVRDAMNAGISLHAWFMIGIPTETRGQIEQTIDFALAHEFGSVGFSIGTPWPGTVFEQVCSENGWILSGDWEDFNEKRCSRIRTPDWGPEDIARYRDEVIGRFRRKRWDVNESDFTFGNPFRGYGPFRRGFKILRRRCKAAFRQLVSRRRR